MKRLILLLVVMVISFTVVFGEESGNSSSQLESQGMRVGVGAMVGFKSPVIVAGANGKFAYNEEFTAQFKNISIDEFLFGIPVRLDWVWENDKGIGIGIQLDLDTAYMPTGNYSQLLDKITALATNLITPGESTTGTQEYDVEHGIRADLTPMFLVQYKIFRFSMGVGMTLDVNISQASKASKSLEGDTEFSIADNLARISYGGDASAITDKASLQAALTPIQQMAFYGLGMDVHLKSNFDFMLGKHAILGGTFMVRFNSEMANWKQGADLNTNMSSVFDPSQFEGLIGFRFLWMF